MIGKDCTPAARRCRGEHVVVLVDDVRMDGVSAHLAEAARGRLAGVERADRLAVAVGAAQLDDGAKARDRAGPKVERSLVGDDLAVLVFIGDSSVAIGISVNLESP